MLTPLATEADLADRNIVVPDDMYPAALLDAASSEVRDAAGCAINQQTSTVDLVSDGTCDLSLLAGPVTAISAVAVEGVAVDESTFSNGSWSTGWRRSGDRILFDTVTIVEPATITVTFTHGLPVVPADIVDLVCGMVSIAVGLGGDGYGMSGRSDYVKLGDFAERAATPKGTESPSPMALPDSVRERLRARFGNSAALIRVGGR